MCAALLTPYRDLRNFLCLSHSLVCSLPVGVGLAVSHDVPYIYCTYGHSVFSLPLSLSHSSRIFLLLWATFLHRPHGTLLSIPSCLPAPLLKAIYDLVSRPNLISKQVVALENDVARSEAVVTQIEEICSRDERFALVEDSRCERIRRQVQKRTANTSRPKHGLLTVDKDGSTIAREQTTLINIIILSFYPTVRIANINVRISKNYQVVEQVPALLLTTWRSSSPFGKSTLLFQMQMSSSLISMNSLLSQTPAHVVRCVETLARKNKSIWTQFLISTEFNNTLPEKSPSTYVV